MARALASLTISFGLVAIPVKLYSATRSAGTLRFNLLHAKDGSRLKQQYVCEKEDVVVGRDEIVKGLQFSKGRYVTFTNEEMRSLEEWGTHSVDIAEFVPLGSVDPVYFDRSYYLVPDKGGAKPCTLFAKALSDTGRCAIGRWASHGRGHVVMLRPAGAHALTMQQLHYAAEVLPISELEVADASVREPELKLARQLIEQQAKESFEPSAYRDDVRERVEASVQQRVKGEKVTLTEPVPTGRGNVIDLMDALRASLEHKSGHPAAASAPAKRRPPRRAAHKRTAPHRRAAHN
jgi:DNA end-binding protein Ku